MYSEVRHVRDNAVPEAPVRRNDNGSKFIVRVCPLCGALDHHAHGVPADGSDGSFKTAHCLVSFEYGRAYQVVEREATADELRLGEELRAATSDYLGGHGWSRRELRRAGLIS